MSKHELIGRGTVVLPQHLMEGLGIGRDRCEVFVYEEGGLSEDVLLQCSARNQKTISGCRTNYQLGNFTIYGCPFRNTNESYQHSLRYAEKNLGLKLELEKKEDSGSEVK